MRSPNKDRYLLLDICCTSFLSVVYIYYQRCHRCKLTKRYYLLHRTIVNSWKSLFFINLGGFELHPLKAFINRCALDSYNFWKKKAIHHTEVSHAGSYFFPLWNKCAYLFSGLHTFRTLCLTTLKLPQFRMFTNLGAARPPFTASRTQRSVLAQTSEKVLRGGWNRTIRSKGIIQSVFNAKNLGGGCRIN